MSLQIDFFENDKEEKLNDRIRNSRASLGYTQSYVAQCLQMSTRQYVKYESGEIDIGKMSFQQGINLCELLHIEIYKLITPLRERLGNS